MKIIIYIVTVLLMFTPVTFSQSVIEYEAGTHLTLEPGTDLCADVIIIKGTFSGGGTICGSIAYVLNLTVLIQGFYNPSTNIMVSDTATVYLRNTTTPYAIIDTARSVLDNSGVGTFIFSNVSNGTNYYLDIRHRNSIETWSAAGQSFTTFWKVYDFSNASSQAFGNNMTQVNTSPVKFGIYSGDINQDGIIDITDNELIDSDAYNFVSGYVNTDVNGDDVVDLADAAIADDNAYNFVGRVTPP